MKNIDEIMKQYAKDMGMTEDQLASYILQEYGEPQKGIVTPDDNGWTDLKKLGLAIGDSWNKHRENTDPMWRVGLVNAIFGDTSMLGQYYQMQNQNAENEKNRQTQEAYNNMFKDIDGKTELARLGKEYVQANDEPTRLYLKQEMRRQAVKAGVPENEIDDFIRSYTGARDSQLETERRQRANFNILANEIRKNGIPSRTVDAETGLSPWDQMADRIESSDISDDQRDSLYSLLSGETAEEKKAKDAEADAKKEADEDNAHAKEVARQKAGVRAKIKAKKAEIKAAEDKTLLTKAAKLTEELKSLEAELAAIK